MESTRSGEWRRSSGRGQQLAGHHQYLQHHGAGAMPQPQLRRADSQSGRHVRSGNFDTGSARSARSSTGGLRSPKPYELGPQPAAPTQTMAALLDAGTIAAAVSALAGDDGTTTVGPSGATTVVTATSDIDTEIADRQRDSRRLAVGTMGPAVPGSVVASLRIFKPEDTVRERVNKAILLGHVTITVLTMLIAPIFEMLRIHSSRDEEECRDCTARWTVAIVALVYSLFVVIPVFMYCRYHRSAPLAAMDIVLFGYTITIGVGAIGSAVIRSETALALNALLTAVIGTPRWPLHALSISVFYWHTAVNQIAILTRFDFARHDLPGLINGGATATESAGYTAFAVVFVITLLLSIGTSIFFDWVQELISSYNMSRRAVRDVCTAIARMEPEKALDVLADYRAAKANAAANEINDGAAEMAAYGGGRVDLRSVHDATINANGDLADDAILAALLRCAMSCARLQPHAPHWAQAAVAEAAELAKNTCDEATESEHSAKPGAANAKPANKRTDNDNDDDDDHATANDGMYSGRETPRDGALEPQQSFGADVSCDFDATFDEDALAAGQKPRSGTPSATGRSPAAGPSASPASRSRKRIVAAPLSSADVRQVTIVRMCFSPSTANSFASGAGGGSVGTGMLSSRMLSSPLRRAPAAGLAGVPGPGSAASVEAALGVIASEVLSSASFLGGAVHSFVGDTVVVTFNALFVNERPAYSGARFAWRVRNAARKRGICSSAAVVSTACRCQMFGQPRAAAHAVSPLDGHDVLSPLATLAYHGNAVLLDSDTHEALESGTSTAIIARAVGTVHSMPPHAASSSSSAGGAGIGGFGDDGGGDSRDSSQLWLAPFAAGASKASGAPTQMNASQSFEPPAAAVAHALSEPRVVVAVEIVRWRDGRSAGSGAVPKGFDARAWVNAQTTASAVTSAVQYCLGGRYSEALAVLERLPAEVRVQSLVRRLEASTKEAKAVGTPIGRFGCSLASEPSGGETTGRLPSAQQRSPGQSGGAPPPQPASPSGGLLSIDRANSRRQLTPSARFSSQSGRATPMIPSVDDADDLALAGIERPAEPRPAQPAVDIEI